MCGMRHISPRTVCVDEAPASIRRGAILLTRYIPLIFLWESLRTTHATNSIILCTMDLLVLATMKNAAKCDT